jgi:hypothetical protein
MDCLHRPLTAEDIALRELRLRPLVQIWVCVNERANGDLPSCQRSRGEELVNALQSGISSLPQSQIQGGQVWINRSLCQGSCSAHGVSVVIESNRGASPVSKRFNAVRVEDVPAIVETLKTLVV